MKVERRPLSPSERGVLQERLQPPSHGCFDLACTWFFFPTCCGGLAFVVGALGIGYPLTWALDREYSKSPTAWAGHGPGYGLLILTLLALMAFWIHWRLEDRRLRGRVRKDLAHGKAEILRVRLTAAVIVRHEEGATREEPDARGEASPGGIQDQPAHANAGAGADADANDDDDDADDAVGDAAPILRVYLRIAPTEVLIFQDPDLEERRRGGFPHTDMEFAWGPRSRVLLGIADEGPTLDDVLEVVPGDLQVSRQHLGEGTNLEHGALLIYPEPRDTLFALLGTEPSERHRLWEYGGTDNTLTTRLRLRR